MPVRITWEWLELRLDGLNARWLEAECGMYRGKLNDVKRGKVALAEPELARIQQALGFFKP